MWHRLMTMNRAGLLVVAALVAIAPAACGDPTVARSPSETGISVPDGTEVETTSALPTDLTTLPESTTTEPSSMPSATVDLNRWQRYEMPRLADATPQLVEFRDDLYVVSVATSETGDGQASFTVHRLPPGGQTLETVTELSLDARYAYGGQVTAGDPGLIAFATLGESFTPIALFSADGTTWQQVTLPGGPGDVGSAVWTGSAFVAVGVARPAVDPGGGPFAPRIWRSADGLTWVEVPTDPAIFPEQDGYIGWPVMFGGDLVVAGGGLRPGEEYQHGVLARSADNGDTWTPLPTPADASPYSAFSSLAATADRLITVSEADFDGDGDRRVESFDGSSWSPIVFGPGVDPLAPRADTLQIAAAGTVVAAGGAAYIDAFTDAELCYDEPTWCEVGNRPLAIAGSVAGGDWVDLALPDAGVGDQFIQILAVTPLADGRLAVLRSAETTDLLIWPGPDLPARNPIPLPTPSGVPMAVYEQTLDGGVEYRYPLYFHCGIDFLGTFNGSNWYATETLIRPEADGLPRANGQTLLGTMTLVAADRIEYHAAGQLIAVYAPRVDDPPGCARLRQSPRQQSVGQFRTAKVRMRSLRSASPTPGIDARRRITQASEARSAWRW